MIPFPAGQMLHRIHLNIYGGDAFNPGVRGNARFSPIQNATGSPIPTLYGGTTFECAAMETVFHDIPFAPGLKTFDKKKLSDQVYSTIVPRRDLRLVDLSVTALRALGIKRNQLIDTEKNKYPDTRKWAEALHAACPAADGLRWISRQDDRAMAVVLFGDRIARADLTLADGPSDILNVPIYSKLLQLADRIGVDIV